MAVRKDPIAEIDAPVGQRKKRRSKPFTRLLYKLAFWYLSGQNMDIFAITNPDLRKYIGAIGSVYSGCERARIRSGKPINLRRAYKHIMKCPTCKDRFYKLKESREMYERGTVRLVHPKPSGPDERQRTTKRDAADISKMQEVPQTRIKIGIIRRTIMSYRESKFEQRHPDLEPYTHYIRGVYVSCERTVITPGAHIDLEKAWSHISACSECSDHYSLMLEKEREMAESPMSQAE